MCSSCLRSVKSVGVSCDCQIEGSEKAPQVGGDLMGDSSRVSIHVTVAVFKWLLLSLAQTCSFVSELCRPPSEAAAEEEEKNNIPSRSFFSFPTHNTKMADCGKFEVPFFKKHV